MVAGVIGKNKFAYDIWGDAVNLASRLEALGEPNRINISEETADIVKDQFRLTFRGQKEVHNKGWDVLRGGLDGMGTRQRITPHIVHTPTQIPEQILHRIHYMNFYSLDFFRKITAGLVLASMLVACARQSARPAGPKT